MIPDKTQERQVIPLAFQDRAVRTVLIDGVPWFIAKDVCDILGLVNPRKTLQDFPDNERMTLDTSEGHSGQRGGAQFLNAVNEPGLYRLIFQSRKPEAEQFKSWVFNAVLPQIRQTGAFVPNSLHMDEQLLPITIARYLELKRSKEQFTLELGKYLIRLKATMRHGEFLPRLSEMGIPHRNAARCMQRFRQFTEQELLKQEGFGEQPYDFNAVEKMDTGSFPDDDDLVSHPRKPEAEQLKAWKFNTVFPKNIQQLSLFHFNNELQLNAV
jgi:prophage antirepressor-like protein